MLKSRLGKTVLSLGVAAACAVSLAACSGSQSASSVAATVNGTEIAEQTVTDQIETIRAQSGLDDEEQWGTFLVSNDMTPSSVREQIIDSMTREDLVQQGAKDLGLTVESSEVDEYVQSMKSNYDSDEAWNKALEQAGFTEDSYRETIEKSLYEQKVDEHFKETAELTDEDYVEAAKTYAPYYDGAKRTSHILVKVDDKSDEAALAAAKEKAQGLLDQINAGTLDFAEAAKQYSDDTGSAQNGGDVGWDVLNSFVTEYTDAVDELELGQVSGLVESDYGIHIIKVTEVFEAPEEITSLDQIPEDFQESVKSMAESMKANDAYTEWSDGLKENADIVVNDMPEGLPYDIDLTPYQEAAESESADEEAEDVDGDGEADAEVEEADAEAEAESESQSEAADTTEQPAESESSSSAAE